MLSDTKIINLLGGPGTGKSTTAARVFAELKQFHVKCELVTELAKDIVWEETHKLLDNQLWLFSEQFRRQWRLLDKVDFVITDSPLIMYPVYLEILQEKLPPSLKFSHSYFLHTSNFFKATFLEFRNLNFILERYYDIDDGKIVYPTYSNKGRTQDIDQALELDFKIQFQLEDLSLPFSVIKQREIDPKGLHPITEMILSGIRDKECLHIEQ